LTPADVAGITEADLVVYLAHFQPAVDDAVAAEADPTHVLDVSDSARLVEADEATHAAEEAEHEDDHGTLDPHFWLDPTRMADVGTAVAQRLADLDPDNAADYEANAAELAAALTDLDSQYRQGLADCQSRDLVTSHEAFGYLARAYGLTQRGISGLSPEQEPTPQQLADAAAFVAANKVTTIYYETLISPDIAKTVATETGAATAVLDPIEGLSESSAGEDYLQVMATNLQTLREGQQCR
jgi:zinc transport system substrate-binding protein